MKIIQILCSAGEGGLEKHVIELSNGLSNLGHEVILIADKYYKEKLSHSVTLHPFNFNGSRYNPVVLFRLIKTILREQPDIVHAHASKASAILAQIRPFLKSPTIATVHGIKKRLGFLSRLDAVIGVSQHITEISPNRNTFRVYNGIEPPSRISKAKEKENRKIFTNDPNTFIWLAVGRLAPVKGFDILIESFKDINGILLIAGGGPELENLKKIISTNGLDNKVFMLGHRNDVSELLQSSDAVVISSRREGFSYVFAEALLTGTPVISTDVPIPNEVLPAHLICTTNSIRDLKTLMEKFDPNDHSHDLAQEFGMKYLTLDAMIKNTLDAYEETVNKMRQTNQ